MSKETISLQQQINKITSNLPTNNIALELSSTFASINTTRLDLRWVYVIADETAGGASSIYLYNGLTRVAQLNPSTGGLSSGAYLGAMSSTARDSIASPIAGSYIFNTTTGFHELYEDTYWTWMPIGVPQAWVSKYGYDYTRIFYTINNDQLLAASLVNSGTISGGAPTGATAESSPSSILSTAALATGRAAWISGGGAIVFGSGQVMIETRVQIPTLSTSSDRFIAFSGFSDNTTGVDVGNGMGIFYDEGGVTAGSTASPNWQLVTAVNNVRTINPTSIAVVINTWIKLRTQAAIDGTWIRYYINDVLVNPSNNDVTTNIPTGLTRATRINTFIHKTIGTNPRTMYVGEKRFRTKYSISR